MEERAKAPGETREEGDVDWKVPPRRTKVRQVRRETRRA